MRYDVAVHLLGGPDVLELQPDGAERVRVPVRMSAAHGLLQR